MATVGQIHAFVNSLSKQAYGSEAISPMNANTIVDFGRTTMLSGDNRNAVLTALNNQIFTTIVAMRLYEDGLDDDILKKVSEYGQIMRKIHMKWDTARVNNSYNQASQNYVPGSGLFDIYNPDAVERYFEKRDTWEHDGTVYDNQLKSAFVDETSFSAFVSAHAMAIMNAIRLEMERYIEMVRATLIAVKLNSSKPMAKINLVEAYAKEVLGVDLSSTHDAITYASLKRNQDFNIFCGTKMKLIKSYMSKPNVNFNESDGYQKFTPDDKLVVNINQDFAENIKATLYSQTFHNEFVELPRYKEKAFWQGVCSDNSAYEFEDVTKISVTLNDTTGLTSEPTEITKSGIVALMYDYDALGVLVESIDVDTQRNGKDRFTNYFYHVDRGAFIDDWEQAVVFYVEDIPAVA